MFLPKLIPKVGLKSTKSGQTSPGRNGDRHKDSIRPQKVACASGPVRLRRSKTTENVTRACKLTPRAKLYSRSIECGGAWRSIFSPSPSTSASVEPGVIKRAQRRPRHETWQTKDGRVTDCSRPLFHRVALCSLKALRDSTESRTMTTILVQQRGRRRRDVETEVRLGSFVQEQEGCCSLAGVANSMHNESRSAK